MPTYTGNNGSNTINGSNSNDTIYGLGGNDDLDGRDGNDTIFGGTGNDDIEGGNGNDTLHGEDGNDEIFGEAGNDTITGGRGDDEIYGGSDSDVISGGDDEDYISGGTGNDNLSGDNHDDVILGDDGDDVLSGGSGNDTLSGGNHNDNLSGGTGNDSLSGGSGNDTASGGDGEDNISGGTGNDNLSGDNNDDTIAGDDGDDTLNGGDGNDELDGGNNNDIVNGGAGNDQLSGGAGNDRLTGGGGLDYIDGGSGTDTAVYSGNYSEYTIYQYGSLAGVIHNGPGGPGSGADGADLLVNVERLQFNDFTIDLVGNNAPIAVDDAVALSENAGTYSSGSASVIDNDIDFDGDTLTVTPGTFAGTYGTLTLNANGTYSYALNATAQGLDTGEVATDSFSYTVSDGVASDTGTLTFSISGANDAPVANDDAASTSEDAPVSGNVLANDTDVDGEPLTVANPGTYVGSYGTLVLAANGSYTYTPNAAAQGLDDGESVSDFFAYMASDGTASDGATLTVTVNGSNDAPVANDDTAATSEDASVSGNVLANDTDPDGETLTVASPGTYVGSYGTLVLAANGSYNYTPNAAAQGLDDGEVVADAFTYTASDGTASDTATLTVTVSGLNDAPVANDDAASTTEDAPVSGNVLANDTDVDGETLTVSNPGTYVGTYGTLVLAADGSYTYTPNAAAQGLDDGESVTDSFAYVASDGTASDTATLTVTVNGLNDGPVANDDAASTTEDAAVSGNVLANDTDDDGETLTVANPGTYAGTYGTLTLAADGSYSYTPNAAAQGLDDGEVVADAFTYTASDGTASDSATLTVTVTGLNDAPVANDDAASTTEDAAVSGNVLANDTDVDGETLTVANPGTYVGAYGTLVLAADGSYTYTPNAAAQGLDDGESITDSFAYVASDGTASDTATLTVTVNGLNDGPVANDDVATTTEDAPASGNVLANDTDDDGETLTVSNPGSYVGTYGTLVLAADGSYTYTPYVAAQTLDDGEVVSDAFAYTASDGTASDSATLTVTVNGLNDAPVANDDTATTSEDAAVSGNVLANDTDVDGEALTVSNPGTYAGTYGTLTLAADGSYTYTPNAAANGLAVGETGQDVFAYTASDGTASEGATLTVTVNGANDAPTIDTANTDASGSVTELPNNDPLENAFVHTESGNIAFDDADLTDTHSASFTPDGGGYVGIFTLDPVDQVGDNVGWDFVVDDSEIDFLDAGETLVQTYTVEISDGNGGTATQDVTITITGAADAPTLPEGVWFIDNSAVGSANTGTQSDPYTSIASFNAAQGTPTGPQPGDTVYLRQGTGTYAEPDGINLLDGQVLIGGGEDLVIGSVTYEEGTGRPTIVTTAGANHGVEVALNNSVSGLDIGSTTGAGISDGGGSVGTLTVSNVGKSGDGQIADIDQGGTLNVSLNSASSTGSSGGAIDLAGVGGSFTIGGAVSITGTQSGGGIDVTGSSATVTLAGGGTVSTGTTTAVNYVGNSGSLVVGGGLDLVTSSGAGLNATGGGTVTITGAGSSVTSTTGTAVTISGTTIGAAGVTLDSVSSTGAVSGIVLASSGAGDFTVAGTGAPGSGGTITGSTGAGVSLTNTGQVVLTDMTISAGATDGIAGTSVGGIGLIGVTISGNGNAAGENGVEIVGLTGVSLIEDSVFTGNAENQLHIIANGGRTDLTVTGTSFTGSPAASSTNDGFFLEAQGTSELYASITDSVFLNNRGDHFQFGTDGAASTTNLIFDDNVLNTTVAGVLGGNILISPAGSSDLIFSVDGNNVQNAVTTAINIGSLASTAASDVQGTVSGNTVGTPGLLGSGSDFGDGIAVAVNGNGTVTALVEGNSVYQWQSFGIFAVTRSGSGRLNATIEDNLLQAPNTVSAAGNAIRVQAGAVASDSGQVWLEMNDNNSNTALAQDVRLWSRFNADILMPGYGGAPNDTVAVDAFMTAKNPLAGEIVVLFAATPGSGFFDTPGGVPVPLPIDALEPSPFLF